MGFIKCMIVATKFLFGKDKTKCPSSTTNAPPAKSKKNEWLNEQRTFNIVVSVTQK